MKLRRFNNEGLSKFKEFLLAVDGKAKIEKLQDLLISNEYAKMYWDIDKVSRFKPYSK